MHEPELSMVIPFYNEEGNVIDVVSGLISEFKNNNIDYELILVNNGSCDSTSKIIDKLKNNNPRIRNLDITKNKGYGHGIINGLDIAKGRYIGFIDGDNQVHPKHAVNAYNKIKETKAAVCISKRFRRGDVFIRKIASFFYNSIINFLFLTNITDINSKPKIIDHKFYKELKISSKDWFIDTEILLKSKRKNYKIVEIQVMHKKRLKGKSNVKLNVVIEFFLNIIKYKLGLSNGKS